MKLHHINRSNLQNNSFSIKQNIYPYFLKIWHCHPELELVIILKSSGTRFIGDSIEKFDVGDIVLIGKNLPHMWLNDEVYFSKDSNLKAEAIAIHFKASFLGHDFFSTPEMKPISELFEKANSGIFFQNVPNKLIENIKQISTKNGFKRTIAFLKILNQLAKQAGYKLLASNGYTETIKHNENNNLNNIYQYIFNNFTSPISLETIAEIAHMNPSAFSRFFKRIHRKPFSRYLNEIRIGYACRLLIEKKYNITEICYESGFNNLSNFNRQFKIIKNMSPSDYLNYHK